MLINDLFSTAPDNGADHKRRERTNPHGSFVRSCRASQSYGLLCRKIRSSSTRWRSRTPSAAGNSRTCRRDSFAGVAGHLKASVPFVYSFLSSCLFVTISIIILVLDYHYYYSCLSRCLYIINLRCSHKQPHNSINFYTFSSICKPKIAQAPPLDPKPQAIVPKVLWDGCMNTKKWRPKAKDMSYTRGGVIYVQVNWKNVQHKSKMPACEIRSGNKGKHHKAWRCTGKRPDFV